MFFDLWMEIYCTLGALTGALSVQETGSDLPPVTEEVVLKRLFAGVFVVQHLGVESGDFLRRWTQFHWLPWKHVYEVAS